MLHSNQLAPQLGTRFKIRYLNDTNISVFLSIQQFFEQSGLRMPVLESTDCSRSDFSAAEEPSSMTVKYLDTLSVSHIQARQEKTKHAQKALQLYLL